jgi:hypothetical protein
MKKTISLLSFLILCLGSVLTHAQDLEVPSGALVRMTSCIITDDRFSFNDVVERARELDFDDNAPNMIFFRRPIYTTSQYQEDWDFQIAAYYSSYTEMVDRRVSSGNGSYGRLPISCGNPMVVRNIAVNPGDGLAPETAMLTRQCSLNEGASTRGAYNRLRTAAENVSAAGNNTLLQMWLPGVGGPLNSNFDFILAQVGPTRQELTERMDMQRDGFRPLRGNSAPAFSCDRPSMWATSRVYQAAN